MKGVHFFITIHLAISLYTLFMPQAEMVILTWQEKPMVLVCKVCKQGINSL